MGGQVIWTNVGALASGESTNLTLAVTAPASGNLTNIVSSSATTGDPDLSNNDGTAAAAKVVTVVYPLPVLSGRRIAGVGYQVTFNTVPNSSVSIEASTNLLTWQTLVTTNSGAGSVSIIDQNAGTYPRRFYRSVQAP
jgi:hypothetical protein